MSDLTLNTTFLKTSHKTVEELKLYDVRMKMDVAKHIVTACMTQKIDRINISQNAFYILAQSYGTTSNLLTATILAKINKKNKPKTFSDWFEERSWENSEDLNNATRSLDIPLRQCIIDHYLHMQCLPSYASVCDYLKTKGIYMTVDETKKILKTKGYKSQCLPRNTASIIVENPEQRFNRMKYLHSLMQFRQIDHHIVYIDEKFMSNQNRFSENYVENGEMTSTFIAVSSLMGVISKYIRKTTLNIAANSNETTESMDNWILNNVLPHLSTPSVIVLENRKSNAKSYVPTVNSNKSDMINWLNENDLPHSSEMHSAELFELIKRSKRFFPTERNKLDEILKAHGHRVLRRPHRMPYLNIFDPFWNQLQIDFEKNETAIHLSDLISLSSCSVDVSEWKKLETMLIQNEKKIYNDDDAVDEIIDKLLTYAKHATIPYTYIHKCDEDIDEIKMAEIVQN